MKVLILHGGDSPERAVSLDSARAVMAALETLGHSVVSWDPWRASGSPAEAILEALGSSHPDVVFVALHGGAGENGKVQSVLDLARVPYTGSGVRASVLAMDKILAKMLFERFDVPTPSWREVNASDTDGDEAAAALGFPLVVKPAAAGSTVGISVVRSDDELPAALGIARSLDDRVLVETFVSGRELTVGVLDGRALPVVEIVPESGFYDYDAKYTAGKSCYEVPARLPEADSRRLQTLAERAVSALGCRGGPRVDFRLSENGEPFCLEVNTIPGLTPTSLLPKAALEDGTDFAHLVEQLCHLADFARSPGP